MILDFGHVSTELNLLLDASGCENEALSATYFEINPGGKALNQAVAAARTGAKLSLIGAIGDDIYATPIIETLRREGISFSGLIKSNKPTGVTVFTKDKTGKKTVIKALGANEDINPNQIPSNLLNKKSLLLIQTDVMPAQNNDLLARAHEGGTITMMNLSPSIEITLSTLKYVDYLIVNQLEAKKLCTSLGIEIDTNVQKLAATLAQKGELNCIITIGAKGSIGVSKNGQAWSIEALPIEKVIDTSGAEDSYCGTLAACIQAGHTLPRSMKRASIAASLTCTRYGTLKAFPYLDEIEKNLNNLADPKKIELA